jgi:hypothetical protein
MAVRKGREKQGNSGDFSALLRRESRVNWDALSAAVRRRSFLRRVLRGASDAVGNREEFGLLESQAQAGGDLSKLRAVGHTAIGRSSSARWAQMRA